MRASRFAWTTLVLASFVAMPDPAYAQDAAAAQALRTEIDQLKADFDARLSALESRLAALGGAQPAATPGAPATPTQPTAEAPAPVVEVPPGAQGAGGPSGAIPLYGNASANSKMFNPDMAVIGNFRGVAGRNRVAPEPALEMRESELSLQAVVDPYARADFFIAFGETGVDLEEGFITFPALPEGLLTKVGKMRAAFGKVNTLHTHALTWADRPIVTDNLLGGEEGIDDAGISVERLIPNPWIFLEATGQVFRGDSDDVFHSSKRGDLSYVGHVRGYHDITENANLDLGASYARGHNTAGLVGGEAGLVGGEDVGRFVTNLVGIDATVRWKPLQRAIYHSFLGRSELVFSRRGQVGGVQDAKGFYVSGDYQIGRRWFTGLRFDWSDRAADASLHDSGTSMTVSYWPSEFSQVRAQIRQTTYAEGETANEVLFQLQFGIGAHAAHVF